MAELKSSLETLLSIPVPQDEVAKKYKQPFGIFTPDGQRLEGLSAMTNAVVFLFEGGQFIWPGIRVGHKSTAPFSVCMIYDGEANELACVLTQPSSRTCLARGTS